MVIIIMGVSGSGKTTIGKHLTQALGLPFYDADDFHPIANVAKMKRGEPLTDADRIPWLNTLAECVQSWQTKGGAVLACSALKESYRQILVKHAQEDIKWVFLDGSKALIESRMALRKNHFMPSALLDSQLNTLEKPDYGIHINIDTTSDLIVEELLIKLKNDRN
ncbi:MAG: gluconokinase [Bacteroidota bacterium]